MDLTAMKYLEEFRQKKKNFGKQLHVGQKHSLLLEFSSFISNAVKLLDMKLEESHWIETTDIKDQIESTMESWYILPCRILLRGSFRRR